MSNQIPSKKKFHQNQSPIPNPKLSNKKNHYLKIKKRIKMNHPKKFLAKSKEEYQNQIQVMIPVMKKF
jgi:hypothetical protein